MVRKIRLLAVTAAVRTLTGVVARLVWLGVSTDSAASELVPVVGGFGENSGGRSVALDMRIRAELGRGDGDAAVAPTAAIPTSGRPAEMQPTQQKAAPRRAAIVTPFAV